MAIEIRFKSTAGKIQIVEIDQPRLLIGKLTSNQIILNGSGVDPIHALLEEDEEGQILFTDLGGETGIFVNGKKVDVEQAIQIGDVLKIGEFELTLHEKQELPPPPQPMPKGASTPPPPPGKTPSQPQGKMPPPPAASQNAKAKRQAVVNNAQERRNQGLLFTPRSSRPSGDVLEVVAYWGETILEIEHFHRDKEGFKEVTIGDPTKAHFLATGSKPMDRHVLAELTPNGYILRLTKEMKGRLRRSGANDSVEGGSHKMKRRDIAHVQLGPVHYFFLYMRPPSLHLPKTGPSDPFFMGLLAFFMLFYLIAAVTMISTEPKEKDRFQDDVWSVVHLPDKKKKPRKKPKIEIAKVVRKPPPRPTPVKPKPKPVKIVKKIEPKPKPKPVIKPKPKANPKPIQALTKAKTQAKSTRKDKRKGTNLKPASSRRAKPALARRGGGGTVSKGGGQRKGSGRTNVKGVAGAKNSKSSGVNLGKLGLGVGKIKSISGAGGIRTNFKNSAGGAGGGSGTGSKNLGLGGVETSGSLGLTGSSEAANSFGSGKGVLAGKGGLGNRFGGSRKPAKVNVNAGDPLVSGGISPNEVLAVIRANLNSIRHCYERLLQSSPNASGKIQTKFIVGLNGSVSNVSIVSSSISDGSMQGCVTRSIKRWRFAKPRGNQPVTVTYPFAFNPI